MTQNKARGRTTMVRFKGAHLPQDIILMSREMLAHVHEIPEEWAAEPSAEAETRPSKSQRKRDAQALQALGAQLVALSPGHLAQLHLPDALREAVVAAQGMRSHGARTRQMQYIGKLMRQLDPASLRTVCEALEPGRASTPRPQP
jgi:ribosome-associated protein